MPRPLCLGHCPGHGNGAKSGQSAWRLTDAVLSGYREQARGFLTEGEKEYLFDAVRLIAYEQALRFFADYIAGDVYYKVREDGQNLMRARVQVQLCLSIEANEPKIRRMPATL